MYTIYWLISEDKKRTYIGFSNEIEKRINQHKNKHVNTTKNFGNFKVYKIDNAPTAEEARKKERER